MLRKIAGVTRLDGNIAQATLRLYDAATGAFRAETTSDVGTGEYSFEDDTGNVMAQGETFFVLADYGSGVRPLAHGPISPVEDDVPALWTPAEIITGLWLDAADENTFSLDASNNVWHWGDKSGNDIIAVQMTASARPAYSTNRVVFDGADDFLDVGTQLGRPVNYTLFFVVKFTKAFSNNQSLCAQLPSNGASSLTSQYIFNRSNAPGKMEWSYGDGTNYRARRTASALTINTTTIIGLKHTGGVQDESVYFNGSLIANENASYGPGAATNIGGSEQSWRIGRHGEFSTGSFFGGEINEIIVLTSAASDTDREKIEGYLAHKWGLQDSLPGDHPYKDDPPYLT